MLRRRQMLGKYRVERRIDRGGFADVFHARDTIEGISVALKIPHAKHVDKQALETFRREARIVARLDHPNILPIKTADFIGDRFVIVYPLGRCSLTERLRRRLSFRLAMDFAGQLLEALAHAHSRHVLHCDVKPDNVILFDGDRLRLTDFGIAKLAHRTLRAEGTGTLGFIAPEQAMGRPSLRSDVFSAGLVLYRLFAGDVPEWPYEWPFPGHRRLREKAHPDLIEVVRRATRVQARERYADAVQMLEAFTRVRPRALGFVTRRRTGGNGGPTVARDWKAVRRRQFQREFGSALETRHACGRCRGPVAETMRFCPWCRAERRTHPGSVRFPAACPRCKRGVKSDWRFCPWCWGAAIGPLSNREYGDVRYEARCTSAACERKDLMPFMRYCPWCRTKVRRRWRIPGHSRSCRRCGWGVLHEYWEACPWCGLATAKGSGR